MGIKIEKKYTLKLWIRIMMAIIILLGILFPILKLIQNHTTSNKKNTENIYTSNINKNIDYKIQLYDNNFVEDNEMGANKVYISDLVKNIKLELYYTYAATDKANLKYIYTVDALLYGENINNSTGSKEKVWEKNYQLVNPVTKNLPKTSGFNVTNNLNIDYPKYKQEVTSFKKQFGMNLNTNLKITMTIKITGKYKKKEINKTDNIILEIPLGVQAFSIKEDFQKKGTYKIPKYDKISQNKKHHNNIYIIMIITSIILLLFTYKIILNIKTKSKYSKTVNKILKTYDQIIVDVETKVDEEGYTITLVKEFEEMVDLEEELRIPIIFYEHDSTATFTITYNNTIYKYEITDDNE